MYGNIENVLVGNLPTFPKVTKEFFGQQLEPGFYGIVGGADSGKTWISHYLRDNDGYGYLGVDEPDEKYWRPTDESFWTLLFDTCYNPRNTVPKQYVVINSFKARMFIPNDVDKETIGDSGIRNNLFLMLTALSIEYTARNLVGFGILPFPPSKQGFSPQWFIEKVEQASTGVVYCPYRKSCIYKARKVNDRQPITINLAF